HLTNHRCLLADEDPGLAVPIPRGTMPVSTLCLLPVRPPYPISLMPGLIGGNRHQLPSHQTALMSVQIEPTAPDGLNPNRMSLHQINQVLQLTRAAVEPVNMPGHNPRRGDLHPLQQLDVAGAL